MSRKRQRENAIRDEIRHILVVAWNPIGLPLPEDEYDSYVTGIYRLLASKASAHKVAQRLRQLEVESMGLEGRGLAELVPIAEKLLQIEVDV